MMLDPKPRPCKPSSQTRVNFSSDELYDRLVRPDHPLRRLNEHLDLSFVRETIAASGIYTERSGRYGMEPELFIRVSMLQALYAVSDEDAVDEACTNMAWKWFLGLEVEAPAGFDDSTLSKTRVRYAKKQLLGLVQVQLTQAQAQGLVKAEGSTHFIDSAMSIADAAVLKAVELVRRICGKLREALHPVLSQETAERLAQTDATLRKDTSWLLSSELKEACLKKWSEHCAELIGLAERLLAEPGAPGELGDWARHEKRILRQLEIAQHFLSDQAPKAASEKKDKLASPTDPEARHSNRKHDGPKLGYRLHVEMDEESGLVVGLKGTASNCEDGTALQELVTQAEEQGLKPKALAADSAYADGSNRAFLKDHGIEQYIPQPRPKPSKKGWYIATDFAYDPQAHTVTCPAGAVCSNAHEQKTKGGWNFYYALALCAKCPKREKCLGEAPKHGRAVYVSAHRPLLDEARQRQQTDEHKDALRRRMKIEHKLQRMLNVMGLRHCRYRGLGRFEIQLALVALLVNSEQLGKLKRKQEEEERKRQAQSQAA
jgi:hypothetical protein